MNLTQEENSELRSEGIPLKAGIMTKSILCGVIIMFITATLSYSDDSNEKTSFDSMDEMMQHSAKEAVRLAKEVKGVILDYSEKSIMDVEKLLGTIHEEYRRSPSGIDVKFFAVIFGAYIGEVIRRLDPDAKWDRDHPVVGKYSYPIHWGGGDSFPCAWCHKRIVNGPFDDVYHKYTRIKEDRDDKKK